MGIWQIVMIVLITVSLVTALWCDGEDRKISFFSTLLDDVVIIFILWRGGFFK